MNSFHRLDHSSRPYIKYFESLIIRRTHKNIPFLMPINPIDIFQYNYTCVAISEFTFFMGLKARRDPFLSFNHIDYIEIALIECNSNPWRKRIPATSIPICLSLEPYSWIKFYSSNLQIPDRKLHR